MMRVSIVIPAHNEEAVIAQTLEGIVRHVSPPYEIIVVADHCTDGTQRRAEEFGQRHPQAALRVVHNPLRGCFANSVIAGIAAAEGDVVVPIMADACDDPRTIDAMRAIIENGGADVVCASRYMRGGRKIGGPLLLSAASRLVCAFLRLCGTPTWDATNAYKMYSLPFLRSLHWRIPDGGTEYSLALLLAARRGGARITEVPTAWTWREPPPLLRDEWKALRRVRGYATWIADALRS